MNILILMAGDHVEGNDGKYPIYMTEIDGHLILEEQLRHCSVLSPSRHIFCVKQEDIRDFHVDDVVMQIGRESICVKIVGQTGGAICTALLAAEHIDNDEELIVMAVDDFIDGGFPEIVDKFRTQNCDAGVVSFGSVHPRYSYAKLDPDGFVSEVSEKQPISKHALASVYYFRQGRDFVESAKNVIRKDYRINDSFYISQAINEMILRQGRVGLYKIDNSRFHSIKTQEQLAQYLYKMNTSSQKREQDENRPS